MSARLLHLVEPARSGLSDLESLSALLGLKRPLLEHQALILGGTGAEAMAQDAGVRTQDRLAPPLRMPALAVRSTRRYLSARGKPDAIIAWSPQAAELAMMAAPDVPRLVVLSLPPSHFEPMSRRAIRVLRAATLLIFPLAHLRDAWIAKLTLLGSPSVVIRPAVDQSRLALRHRAGLREEFGIPDHIVTLIPCGEPDGALNARALAFCAGILTVADRPAGTILPPGASQLNRALHFAEMLHPAAPIYITDRPLLESLPAADLAMWFDRVPDSPFPQRRFAPKVGAVGLVWAAAAGLPIVAEDHPAAREALGDYDRVIFVPSPTRPSTTAAMLQALSLAPSKQRFEGASVGQWCEMFERAVLRAIRAWRPAAA